METTEPNWKNLVRLHSNYDGKIVNFCKMHNISVDSFYYYRKKYDAITNENTTHPTFQKIELSHTTNTTVTNIGTSNMISIKIGSSTMDIPDTINSDTLITIMKALASC